MIDTATMRSTTSLKEYRMLYPYTDTVPTLTQMGLVGHVLGRTHLRWLRKERRCAARRKLLKALARPFIWLWKKVVRLAGPSTTETSSPVKLRES